MKKLQFIYEDGDHKWAVIARDPDKPNYLIDTNEYLVIHGDEALLTDPGGMDIFPVVFSAICSGYNPACIKSLFSSHQDPDIISSLSLWLEYNPTLKCYLSWLWSGFIPHFGGNDSTFISIPDDGMELMLNGLKLNLVPAHYLHSPGNFNLYDPKARILFSGDIGAALLPVEESGLYVTDFSQHIKYMEGFHRRWMGSNEAKAVWCDRVGSMKIDMLCPQHGAIFKGEDVYRFIDWFRSLRVGLY